jgi:hypothetical protein
MQPCKQAGNATQSSAPRHRGDEACCCCVRQVTEGNGWGLGVLRVLGCVHQPSSSHSPHTFVDMRNHSLQQESQQQHKVSATHVEGCQRLGSERVQQRGHGGLVHVASTRGGGGVHRQGVTVQRLVLAQDRVRLGGTWSNQSAHGEHRCESVTMRGSTLCKVLYAPSLPTWEPDELQQSLMYSKPCHSPPHNAYNAAPMRMECVKASAQSSASLFDSTHKLSHEQR